MRGRLGRGCACLNKEVAANWMRNRGVQDGAWRCVLAHVEAAE